MAFTERGEVTASAPVRKALKAATSSRRGFRPAREIRIEKQRDQDDTG